MFKVDCWLFDVFRLPAMSQATRISYGIMAALLAVAGVFHLGTLVLTAVFGYFALEQLSFGRKKAL